MVAKSKAPSSFRDPSTQVVLKDGAIARHVHHAYASHYEHLMSSGLYKKLIDEHLLIPHTESPSSESGIYKILKPELVKFITYAHEWSFNQLKDAALCTLKIQRIALDHGMVLKDASAHNIQFHKGRPILIDTGSFELYKEGTPWFAYGQFCRHFLAPLCLMGYRDPRLIKLLQNYLDGVPLDLAASLMPLRSHLNFSLLYHIIFHAKTQQSFDKSNRDLAAKIKEDKQHFNRSSLVALIDDLENTLDGLRLAKRKSTWAKYYKDNTYSRYAIEEKKDLVSNFLDKLSPSTVWDLGANIGIYSEIAAKKDMETIALEMDPVCADLIYTERTKKGLPNLLPFVMDLTNPTPDLGFDYSEQQSLVSRGPADSALALALVHHLAIASTIPLERIARFLGKIANSLIIEFVPKTDPQVQNMLALREDIFPNYSKEGFESAFSPFFTVVGSNGVGDSGRMLYMMKKRPFT
jgi:hypothetical protein